MATSLQPWSTLCKCNKHMECKRKWHTWNRHACMTNTQAIKSEGWTMLWYHSVTPCSHIYPTNWPPRVNLRQEATMILFDLLSHVKKQKHTIQTFNINIRTLRNQSNLSANQPLGPTKHLDHLTSGHSHAMDMPASRDLWMLSRDCKPASRDFFA